MKNEESLASLDNIVYLRDKNNQEAVNLNFRSKLIGGLNEEDVKKYISFMEDKYQQLEQEMNELTSTKDLLQAELAICKATNLEDKKSLMESLEKAQNDLAAYVDECNNKDEALKAINNEKNLEIAQLLDEIRQMAKKQKELEKLSSMPSRESEQIAARAAGLEQENNILKAKIADLEKEKASLNNNRDAEINNVVRELEQQLELEKSRNQKHSLDLKKVQNDLAAYVAECNKKDQALESINAEKDSEIGLLQEEIRQMAEKQAELEKLLSVSNQESEQILESAAGLEQENNILKAKIADLEKEINSFSDNRDADIDSIVLELEQQLELEKSRNEKQSLDLEKAQKDLVAYVDECNYKDQVLKSISDEKNSEINQLQDEIRQMAEKQAELEKLSLVPSPETEQIAAKAEGLEQENDILKAKIADLKKEKISLNENRDAEIDNIVREFEQQLEFEKARNEKQIKDLEMYNQKVVTLEEIIARNLKEIEFQRKLSEKTEQELKLEKARVSNYKILGFKDEIVNIYQQLEHLSAEQLNINNELRHQLEAEQQRADKAENSLAELTKWASELKDKLFNGQNMFEAQVRQFAEIQNQFKTEISGCFQNM